MARPKNADGQRTRQAILDAALELFADKGYFGTSLRDVATAVGVRESALYNYFKSKEALFDALILAHEHSKTQRLASLAGDGPIGDARALLERLALGSIESFLDPREQMLFRLLMSDGIRLARTRPLQSARTAGQRPRAHAGTDATADQRGLAAQGRSQAALDDVRRTAVAVAAHPCGRRRSRRCSRIRAPSRVSTSSSFSRAPARRRPALPRRARLARASPNRRAAALRPGVNRRECPRSVAVVSLV